MGTWAGWQLGGGRSEAERHCITNLVEIWWCVLRTTAQLCGTFWGVAAASELSSAFLSSLGVRTSLGVPTDWVKLIIQFEGSWNTLKDTHGVSLCGCNPYQADKKVLWLSLHCGRWNKLVWGKADKLQVEGSGCCWRRRSFAGSEQEEFTILWGYQGGFISLSNLSFSLCSCPFTHPFFLDKQSHVLYVTTILFLTLQ